MRGNICDLCENFPPGIFWISKKNMESRVGDPPYSFTLLGIMSFDTEHETERLRSDHIHVFVLNDQKDSQDVRADCQQRFMTHG